MVVKELIACWECNKLVVFKQGLDALYPWQEEVARSSLRPKDEREGKPQTYRNLNTGICLG